MNENMKFLEARRYALELAAQPLLVNRGMLQAELRSDTKKRGS